MKGDISWKIQFLEWPGRKIWTCPSSLLWMANAALSGKRNLNEVSLLWRVRQHSSPAGRANDIRERERGSLSVHQVESNLRTHPNMTRRYEVTTQGWYRCKVWFFLCVHANVYYSVLQSVYCKQSYLDITFSSALLCDIDKIFLH